MNVGYEYMHTNTRYERIANIPCKLPILQRCQASNVGRIATHRRPET